METKSQSFNSSNQLDVRNESSNISTTNNSDSKSQLTFDGFIEKYGFYIVMGVVGSMVLMAVLYVGKIIFDRINSGSNSTPGVVDGIRVESGPTTTHGNFDRINSGSNSTPGVVNEISDESGPTTTHGNGDEGYGSIHSPVIISLQQNSTMSSADSQHL